MTTSAFQFSWRKGLAVFTGMAFIGILCAIFLQIPLPSVPSTLPSNGPTPEELAIRAEAEGKLKVTAVILNVTEKRLINVRNAAQTHNSSSPPLILRGGIAPIDQIQQFQDALDRMRGQYLQALTEFDTQQFQLSLDHLLPTIHDLDLLYDELAPFPPQ